MANPKSTTPVIIVKQLKTSSTGVLGTISPLPTVVTCTVQHFVSSNVGFEFSTWLRCLASLATTTADAGQCLAWF